MGEHTPPGMGEGGRDTPRGKGGGGEKHTKSNKVEKSRHSRCRSLTLCPLALLDDNGSLLVWRVRHNRNTVPQKSAVRSHNLGLARSS